MAVPYLKKLTIWSRKLKIIVKWSNDLCWSGNREGQKTQLEGVAMESEVD